MIAARPTEPDDSDRLSRAATLLGHDFADPALLIEALTHPSLHDGGKSYERFEFLGDRVLGLIVADMLLVRYPHEAEGPLAKRFAVLVRRGALAQVAASLGLGDLVALSRGEAESGGRSNPALLADALEAMIAALYLDGGLSAADGFVRRHWTPMMEAATAPPQDPKTRLQEWVQGGNRPLPVYATVKAAGPAHAPTFVMEVRIAGFAPVTGEGSSKRNAEKAAATAFLSQLDAAEEETP